MHSGNRELYRQQSDLMANLIRALVSAIDAKDPYTSGHSERVARIAVRIALEMRCKAKLLNTIYMAGLLHDVGKIGINDAVLRKTGRLSEAEFEHIKIHPAMGHRILNDVRQLADVLPAVLHHHEQWDGRGYPHGLREHEIPQTARILAIADAYDAMTSDRPYRKGMPLEKVHEIFREGSGKQWDPEVMSAYFRAHRDIQEIARQDRAQREVIEPEWA
jgi:HD-GYP domain-containing protein (c-di-GMP phosphodiesterase class II)